MNSYGDSGSVRGGAQASGPFVGHGSDEDWPSNGRSYSVGDGPSAGRASVPSGRASAPVPSGRASASVPSGRASASVPAGRASVGSAPVARATVPGYRGSGYDGFDDEAPGAGGTAVAGRATVGRASVRPISPAVGGPAGPAGPGGRGRGGRPPLSPSAAARAKRRKRLNWIIAAFAVMIMLAGGTVVGVTYYSTRVTLPNDLASQLELSSSLLYAGGRQEIAKVGSKNRVYANIDQIPPYVQKAVASAEDRKFYEHEGIDYVGIMRAAWNNVTGGDQQGASTITQQYARNALKLTDVSYGRKAKEAVLASKLNDQYTKPQIMEFYLNTIYYGRGAYSIESAAQAYFGKSITKVTVAEAAVLAAVIKQPVPTPTHKGYDPAVNPQAAMDRWNYVLDGMQENNWFPAGTNRATLQYPKVKPWDDKTSKGLEAGLDGPTGLVINYVTKEMAEMGLCEPGHCMETIRTGGYRITTSLNKSMQNAAIESASRRKDSVMEGQRKNLMAALVAIDPKTGRVLAYYGGENRTGTDYAGVNWDKNGKMTGGHPPGSSFKVYTLAAALQNGISLKSRWDGRPIKDGAYNIRNAGGNADCGKWCSLDESTVKSLNVPFFHIARQIGASKVVDAARRAGVTTMWDDKGVAYETADLKTEEQVREHFDYHVGFGQYWVTVLEHANGIATLANEGKYNKAHFVVKVEQKDRRTGKYVIKGGDQIKPQERFSPAVTADVASVLQKIPSTGGDSLKEGRRAAGKTGTWQYLDTGRNAHAWMVGYTPQIATAVWIGNVSGEKPILLKNGGDIYGSTLPADVWKKFMNRAHNGMDKQDFPPAANVGDDDAGNGVEPAPDPKEQDNIFCRVTNTCDDNNDGNNNGNNGGNNGGGPGPGNNNLPGLPPDPNTGTGGG